MNDKEVLGVEYVTKDEFEEFCKDIWWEYAAIRHFLMIKHPDYADEDIIQQVSDSIKKTNIGKY